MPNTTPKPAQQGKSMQNKSGKAGAMDAIELLTKDHEEVKAMFEEFDDLGERAHVAKRKLADKICTALTKHSVAEEELFYSAVKDSIPDAEDLVNEAKVEHASATDLIAQILSMNAEDELFDAKVKVLSELIEHHVQEEENEMFPKARQSDLDLSEIGQAIMARKAEIQVPLQH